MTYPRWAWISTFLLSLTGVGVSVYLSVEHATGASPVCPSTGFFNCDLVTTSRYSELFGIPVAYLGLAFFVGAVVLFSPWAWNSGPKALRWVRLGSVTIGLAMVVRLVWAELYRIHAVCLWCTSVHVITLLIFIVTVFAEVGGPQADFAWSDDDDAEEE